MEISGTVLRQVTYVSGNGALSRGAVPRAWGRTRVRMASGSGFCDEGHLQYYQDDKKGTPLLTAKKKLKLLKNLSKLGFALDPEKRALFHDLKTNPTSDVGEVLLRELELVRAKEKEMKKKRKQEKKAKAKASKMNCESSSSSSESSDSDCDKVVDMKTFRAGVDVVVAPAPVDELQLQPPTMLSLPQTTIVDDTSAHHRAMELCSKNDTSVGGISVGFRNESAVVTTAPQKKIEVCMGNKCKRSGAAALLQEFEKVVGVEGGAVVGCKCMGKCKSAPNVRIQNSVDHSLAEGLNDSVKIPANPLCIGVGIDDVDAIVARFLGDSHGDMGFAGAAT
ncbi:diacylglycerol O-acyltransferase 3, cytosolic [Abrus precatorius]|uniref:Diacylglycerol O-acyltransferase 3, cytosolic n=1 Tax=Abrus precatorius TaxID=3816 RepID=A0A8B8JI05_ABRPR|nr:diacylglycerol O-acyltransferase 3, cytosolic [Abrus precatorius]